MIRLRGLRPYIDMQIQFTGVRPGEKIHEALFYDDENPVETIHPNIVKLNNWPPHFVPEQFYDRVVGLVLQNRDSSAAEILPRITEIIEPQSGGSRSNGKLSTSMTQ
jgi:FlaA1/EpsC-like NDP-sugar epimerase